MERKLSGDKDVVKRGAWCPKEDKVLADYIKTHGEGKWSHVAKKTGLNRSGKSCRLRWLNYLRPDVKRGNISPEEEDLIIRMHKLLGNRRWSLIAGRLPGRTDNEIKNFWNINLSKRVPEARPCRIKINAKNDGADEGGNCTAKDDQVQVIQSKTLNCTKAAAMIPSHHHLHDGDQRVNIQDQRVVDDISSSSFLRDLDNFINDVLHESEINGDQNYVVDDQEGAYWMEDIDGHAIPLSDVNYFF